MIFRAGRIAACGLAAALSTACMHSPDYLAANPATALPELSTPYHREAFLVPVEDGTRLAMSVYRPQGEGRYPTLLWILPERREIFDPDTGSITPAMSEAELAFFLSHGYAIALAEMRGGGASFGTRDLDRSPQLGRDGADLVEWIARQEWSDGTLGMVGSSYQGFIQYATAAHAPDGLKAIFPEIAGFDDYGSMFYPGGILNTALSSFASAAMARSARNEFDPASRQFPAVPVIDEDGDGDLADEIPLDLDGDGGFVDESRVAYTDGVARQDIYLSATRDHLDNTQVTIERLEAAPHRDSKLADTDYTYADLDPAIRPLEISRSGIAVYNRGGWFDYHARDTALWFATLQGRTPTRLMMAPTGHGGLPTTEGEDLYSAGPYFAHFGDDTTNILMLEEKLAFFDRYVRGRDNGLDSVDPVLLYVMGKGWRREATWPIARAKDTSFHLADGELSTVAPETFLSGQYQPDIRTSSTSYGASRWNYAISRAENVLTLDGNPGNWMGYDTLPLSEDTEVTGHPILELVLSSTSAEADVFAYLEDVAPDGSSLLVTEGQLRANYNSLQPISRMLREANPAIEVRPQLPWQGFDKTDYHAAPFADGKKVRLVFDLMPTSWVFKAGHRIRLSLAGADTGNFASHPGLRPDDRPVWTVYWGEGQSRLTLPIVPEKAQ